MEEAKERNHQSVDWYSYFKGIREQCPWSYAAYVKGLIDIRQWHRTIDIQPLGKYQARMYLVDYPNSVVEAMADELDSKDTEHEWLFSYPGYGEYATPVPVLIQQNRQQLNSLRQQQDNQG